MKNGKYFEGKTDEEILEEAKTFVKGKYQIFMKALETAAKHSSKLPDNVKFSMVLQTHAESRGVTVDDVKNAVFTGMCLTYLELNS